MPKTKSRRQLPPQIEMFRVRMNRDKTQFELLADFLTNFFGTISFLVANLLFFGIWIVWNLGVIPSLPIFDPYPFGMLTMVVSLEAIVLSIVVLISQNRAAKIADAREEIDFQIDLQAEKQIAAMSQSVDKILHHLKIGHRDNDNAMHAVDLDRLERRVMEEIDSD